MSGARDRVSETHNAADTSRLRGRDSESARDQRSATPAVPVASELTALSGNRLARGANDARRGDLLLRLQRSHGNAYVQRLLAGRSAAPHGIDGATLATGIAAQRGAGQSLPPDTRATLESALGADLSDVRVHTDGEANRLTRTAEARAFTTGADIFVDQGAYNPGSPEGQRLLAHEAVHTVQQAAGPVAGTLVDGISISDPADSFEREAEEIANRAARSRSARSDGSRGTQSRTVANFGSDSSPTINAAGSLAVGNERAIGVPAAPPSNVAPVQRETGAAPVVVPSEAGQRAQKIGEAFHSDSAVTEDEEKALDQIRGQSASILRQIKQLYEETYIRRSLIGDFEQYTSSSQFKEALRILYPILPLYDRLLANVNRGWVFDTGNEEGMLQVLRLATSDELKLAAGEVRVINLLDEYLDADEMFEARKLLTPDAIYDLVIKRIKNAEGTFDDDEAAVYNALLDLTPEQRYRIWTEQWDIFDEFLNGDEMRFVKRMCVNPEGTGPATEAQALAARMDEATAGGGTDDDAVKLVAGRTASAAKEERQLREALKNGTALDGTPLTLERHAQMTARLINLGGIQENLLTAEYEGGEMKEDTFLENLHGDIGYEEYQAFAVQMGVSAFDRAKQQVLDAIGTFDDDEGSIYDAFNKLVGAIEVPLGADAATLTADARARLQQEANQRLRQQLLADPDVRVTLNHYLNEDELAVVATYASGDTYRIALQKLEEAWEGIDADEEGIFKILTGMSAADRARMQAEQPAIYQTLMGPDGLNEDEQELARAAIKDGHIPTEKAIAWAVEGAGTEDPMIAQTFAAMSETERYEYRLGYFLHQGGEMSAASDAERQQQEQARAKFRTIYAWLDGDLGTDDLQEALDQLLGRVPTLQELRSEQGRLMAAGIMHGRVEEKGDIREEDVVSSAVVDYFSESGEVSDQAEVRFMVAYQEALADKRLTDEEFARLAVLDADFARTYTEYVATVNMVADIASTVAAIAVGIIATLASGGTLGPAAAAFCAKVGTAGTVAIAGTIGAAAKVGVSEVVAGEHFDTFSSEGAVAAAVGFTDAASAVLAAGLAERFASLVGLGRAALATEMTTGILQAGEASLATVGKTIAGGAFRSTIEGVLAGAVGELVLTAADEKIWRDSIWGVIQRFGWAVIKGGAIGGATGLVTGGVFETLGAYVGVRRLGGLLTELEAAGVARARLAGISTQSAQTLAQVDALLSAGKVDDARAVLAGLGSDLTPDELDGVWKAMSKHHGVEAGTLPRTATSDAELPAAKSLNPAEPYAILPDGTKIPPDDYAGGYHGTTDVAPEVALEQGLPAGGTDMRLREHAEAKGNSAFRGTSNVPSDPVRETGPAYWADEGGWVYEVRDVPTWDVNKNLEGRVPVEGGGFRGNLMHGENERVVPREIPADKIYRYGVVVTDSKGRLYVREWILNPNFKPRGQ